LDSPRGVVAAQLGGEAQGAVDSCGDAGGKDPVSVQDDPFVDRDCAEQGQQMK
jgi:hypothetical protein